MTAASDTSKLRLREIVALGVGGMVGGGIFSVLGLAIDQAGHAAPVAFALGGGIALLTGLSYARLGLAFRSDGGSFTYLEHAFGPPNIAGIGGWLLVAGYVGTLSLYAYTFGAYGAALLGIPDDGNIGRHLLQSAILLAFLGVNLTGVKASGTTEDAIVLIKVVILGVFVVAGAGQMRHDYMAPVFDKTAPAIVMGAALIFVAYEGFELIPNAVHEMRDPSRDLLRGVLLAIGLTTLIYVLVSLVVVGTVLPATVERYKEYVLAVAAGPSLGHAGFMLVAIAAMLSASSAINATLFGAARLAEVMAQDHALPRVFTLKQQTRDIPWVSLLAITSASIAFVNFGSLTIISSFASATFLLIFAAINLAALRLRSRIGCRMTVPLAGMILSGGSALALAGYLWTSSRTSLMWICSAYAAVAAAELLFSRRRLVALSS